MQMFGTNNTMQNIQLLSAMFDTNGGERLGLWDPSGETDATRGIETSLTYQPTLKRALMLALLFIQTADHDSIKQGKEDG